MKGKILVFSIGIFALIWSASQWPKSNDINSSSISVYSVLKSLGDKTANHELNTNIPKASVEIGRSIVHTGFAQVGNKKMGRKQSKHFVCISCHNVAREDQDLANPNPDDRLNYAEKNGLAFLQGTSLWGAVNRVSWYNEDYELKYGKLVDPARNDLREAIQLCAVECAQGRKLKNWELESILAYLWTLDIKLNDLALTEDENEIIEQALQNKADKQEAIQLIKNKYAQYSPASFVDVNNSKEVLENGNATNGRKIYELSCQHCHLNGKYSFFNMDGSKMTYSLLERHFDKKHSPYSSYQMARKGTYSVYGKRSYMPHYPLERMSTQQLADLKAFFKEQG